MSRTQMRPLSQLLGTKNDTLLYGSASHLSCVKIVLSFVRRGLTQVDTTGPLMLHLYASTDRSTCKSAVQSTPMRAHTAGLNRSQ